MTSRIFMIRLNLDEMSASLAGTEGARERSDWLQGFQVGALGAACRWPEGSPAAIGWTLGSTCHAAALIGHPRQAGGGIQNRYGRRRYERLIAARTKGRHTKAEWAALKRACDERCVRCGAAGPVERDHIIPIHMDGASDSIDNLQPLCAACNGSKGQDCTDHRAPDWRARMEAHL